MGLPSGKRLHNYGKSPFFMGKSTINGPFSIAFCMFTKGLHHNHHHCLQVIIPGIEIWSKKTSTTVDTSTVELCPFDFPTGTFKCDKTIKYPQQMVPFGKLTT